MIFTIKKETMAILAAVLIWASSISIIKVGLNEIEPLTMAFFRTVFASLFLIIIVLLEKESSRFCKAICSDWRYFFILGLIGIVIFNVFQTLGIQRTSTGLAGILLNTNPLFILVLSVLFLKEAITKNKVLSILIGFIGIYLIFFKGQGNIVLFESQTLLGNLLLIGASLSLAVYIVLSKRLLEKYSPLQLTTGAHIFGTIIIFPVVYIFEDLSTLDSYTSTSWLVMIYLGVSASGISYLLWNYALHFMEATRASVFLFLVPPIAILIGWVFLGETITVFTLIGGAFVLLGVYLSNKR